jgi:hypothetical protein
MDYGTSGIPYINAAIPQQNCHIYYTFCEMFPIKRIVQLYAILATLLTFTLAEDGPLMNENYDPAEEYDPLNNYRPRNVTGLGDFYSWVGSYVSGIQDSRTSG